MDDTSAPPTAESPLEDRIDALESVIETQQETIESLETRIESQRVTIESQRASIEEQGDVVERQHTRLETLETGEPGPSGGHPSITRRGALQAGSLLALLGLGTGVVSASDPQGQLGTEDRPLEALYVDGIDGPLTGGSRVESLLGGPLAIEGDSLTVDVGYGLTLEEGTLALAAPIMEPADLDAILDGMERENGTYLVTDVRELQAMAADLEGDYRLDSDIDAGHTPLWHGGAGFDPVGDDVEPFEGTFDGDGHVVEGLTIHRDDEDWVGLFGYTGDGALVTDVTLEDADVIANEYAGTLVGSNTGEIEGSSATGAVSGVDRLGGLVGRSGGRISGSHAAVSVSGGRRAGGLVGYNTDDIETSYATGTVSGGDEVGGLAGYNYGDIETSYATGDVHGDADVGGLVGRVHFPASNVTKSYAIGDVVGDDMYIGGLVGRLTDGTIEESFAASSVDGDNVGGLLGRGFGSSWVRDSYWDVPASGTDDSSSGTGLGALSDDPPADGMTGDDLDGDFVIDLDFANTWDTVSEDDDDADEDGYPVLQAIDRAAQLESRS